MSFLSAIHRHYAWPDPIFTVPLRLYTSVSGKKLTWLTYRLSSDMRQLFSRIYWGGSYFDGLKVGGQYRASFSEAYFHLKSK
jgi:hypothetical protein